MNHRLGVTAVLCALAFVITGTAYAQAPKHTRDKKIKIKVKQSERTKKMKPRKRKKFEIKPELTSDDILKIQGKAAYFKKQQIQVLKDLILETDPDDPELPKIVFRVAEIYSQQNRYWNARAMELQFTIDKYKKNTKSYRKYKAKQATYFKASKTQLENALSFYKSLADNPRFKNYRDMDRALYYYAYTLQSVKRFDQARGIYHRLMNDYPNSPYKPEALLAFAEYFFEENSMPNAARFYQSVLKYERSKVYHYALYKLGWVRLNQQKHLDAAEIFADVVKKTRGKRALDMINKAAKNDYVKAYAEIGQAQQAYVAFKRIDVKYAFKMMQVLGEIYLDKGKAKHSIYTFRELMKIRPASDLVCEWQYNVVHAMLSISSGKKRKADEIIKLVNLWKAFTKRRNAKKAAVSECRESAEAVTSEMARVWHKEAVKTLNPATLAYAERLYKVFVDNFRDSPEVGEMEYYYAELLWSRAENEEDARRQTDLWEQAAVAFTEVVKSGKVKKADIKESAHASVLAWQNALKVDPRSEGVKPPSKIDTTTVPKPKPIAERKQKMIEAFDVYIEYVKNPKDNELVLMKFYKGRIYWQHHHYDKAIPLFENIVQKHLKHDVAQFSVNLLLDSLNRSQKYRQMLTWVDKLLTKTSFLSKNPETKANLMLLKRQSLSKAARAMKESKDYIGCGDAFNEIYNQDPEAANADEMLFASGVCYEEGKSIGAALTSFRLLRKFFPDSSYSKLATYRLGDNFARVGYYKRAAEKYEEYARRWAGQKDAYDALSDAVFYRKGIGDDKQAITNTKQFIGKFANARKKKYAEGASAHFSLTSIYEKQGNNDKVIDHLKEYVAKHGRHGGVDRIVVAYAKIGMLLWRKSCPWRTVNGSCVKLSRSRNTAARRRRARRKSTLRTQCGPAHKIKLKVLERDPGTAKQARGYLQRAVATYQKAIKADPKGAKIGSKARLFAMNNHYAAARFYLIERDYEKFLSLNIPTKLNFDPKKPKKRKDSQKRFQSWMKRKAGMLDRLGREEAGGGKALGAFYQIIQIRGGGAHYALASAARVGQMAQNFADQLFTSPIPKNVRSGPYAEDLIDHYCDALTEAAEPLEAKSLKFYGFCLEKSNELNWFNSWSKLCEKELGQIRPDLFPTASELHADAKSVAIEIDIEKPVLKLDE